MNFIAVKCIILVLLNYTNLYQVFSFSQFEKQKSEASHLLKLVRNKRSNGFMEEYFKSSSLERECYEETCNYEEAREYFENYSTGKGNKMAKKFMKYKNIKKCNSRRDVYKCDGVCQPGWTGDYCERHLCQKNSHFARCGSVCPKTCSNYKHLILCISGCMSRCVCNPGYVLKNVMSKECVLKQTCKPKTGEAPTTAAPTADVPTTAAPTTAAPTTDAPTTAAPSTAAPTTAAPTTDAPTTAAPTTAVPATAAPPTAAPKKLEFFTHSKAELESMYGKDDIPSVQGAPVIQPFCTSSAFITSRGTCYNGNDEIRNNWQFSCKISGKGGVCPRFTNGEMFSVNFLLTIQESDEARKSHAGHDYIQALHMSILFYEAQQSGILPSWNRIPWRQHANLYDGCDQTDSVDLTGGWFDAGDNVKFHLPLSQAVTLLVSGGIEFSHGYGIAQENTNMANNMRFIAEYLLKLHPIGTNIFYGQVGEGHRDHDIYEHPEDMGHQCRTAYKCTASSPCTEPAAGTASALAAASIYFNDVVDDKEFALKCYNTAKSLLQYADTNRYNYHLVIQDVTDFYKSWGGYNDELFEAWSWLAKAHRQYGKKADADFAIKKAISIFNKSFQWNKPTEYSWDNKLPLALINMVELTNEYEFWKKLDDFVFEEFVNRASHKNTDQGFPFVSEWGSNRYAANLALIAVLSVKVHTKMRVGYTNHDQLSNEVILKKARFVLNYILGDNKLDRSYMVGYTKPGSHAHYAKQPHHKSSACKWVCKKPFTSPCKTVCNFDDFKNSKIPNAYILYGGVVGGPDQRDNHVDLREDFKSNEVTIDYNAGVQGLIAALLEYDQETGGDSGPSGSSTVSPVSSETTVVISSTTQEATSGNTDNPTDKGYTCSSVGDISKKAGNEWKNGDSYMWNVKVDYAVPDNKRGKWYLKATYFAPASGIIWWSAKTVGDPPGVQPNDKRMWNLRPRCDWYLNKSVVSFNMQIVADTNFSNQPATFEYCWKAAESC